MRYEENISGWLRAIEDNRIPFTTETIKEDRLSELKHLMQSGLPTFDYYIVKLSSFLSDKHSIKKIYQKYDGHVVIRVIPSDNRYQRLTIIDKTLEDCCQLLAKKIEREAIPYYNIVINEYDPARYSGVIISSPERLIIEKIGRASCRERV